MLCSKIGQDSLAQEQLSCLHITQALSAGHSIKMDAGCELHGYNSDITRCWPVSGSFSPPQRAIYEAVLEINRCFGTCVHRAERDCLLQDLVVNVLRLNCVITEQKP